MDMLQEISVPDVAGTEETPHNVAEEEEVVSRDGQPRTPGGKAQGTQTCLHFQFVKNIGIGGNPVIGVQNQPHAHGSHSSLQREQIEKLTSQTKGK